MSDYSGKILKIKKSRIRNINNEPLSNTSRTFIVNSSNRTTKSRNDGLGQITYVISSIQLENSLKSKIKHFIKKFKDSFSNKTKSVSNHLKPMQIYSPSKPVIMVKVVKDYCMENIYFVDNEGKYRIKINKNGDFSHEKNLFEKTSEFKNMKGYYCNNCKTILSKPSIVHGIKDNNISDSFYKQILKDLQHFI